MKTTLYVVYTGLLLICTSLESSAQSCSGQVKFKEDFGNGNDTDLPPGFSDYTYVASGALNANEYRVSKTSAINTEWHNTNDHTGDANGRMLVVNADEFSGSVYTNIINSLTPLTNYYVSFYALNLNAPSGCSGSSAAPRLQLVIEAYNNATGNYARLSSIFTDYITQNAGPAWQKLHGNFQTPSHLTAVRFRLVNSSSSGCDNDIAIDDITLIECHARTLNVTGLTLSAKKKNSTVQLVWTAAQQSGNNVFILQKSKNASEWQNIQTVHAQANDPQKYTINDTYTGFDLYRIMQVTDGVRTTYSNIVRVNGPAVTLSAYPNPVTTAITIEWDASRAENAVIRIMDHRGKLVKKLEQPVTVGFNTRKIAEFSSLPPGYYMIQLVSADGSLLWKTGAVRQ